MKLAQADVFFDRARLESYSGDLGISIDGNSTVSDNVLQFYEALAQQGVLAKLRPHSMEEELYGSSVQAFAAIELTVTKVEFPAPAQLSRSTVSIWISSPDALARPRNPALNPGAFEGTFVFLVENHWRIDSAAEYERGQDSCIDWLLNELVHANVIPQTLRDKDDAKLHPLERLTRVGGTASPARKINSLFRKSRISNQASMETEEKQFAFFTKKTRREFFDVIGHPVVISSV